MAGYASLAITARSGRMGMTAHRPDGPSKESSIGQGHVATNFAEDLG
jgi:hypothetical protein